MQQSLSKNDSLATTLLSDDDINDIEEVVGEKLCDSRDSG